MASELTSTDRTAPTRSHAFYVTLAALLAGLVPLLAYPVSEIGFIDDWSYSKMAFDVLHTGTFRYDGWTTPAMGPQAHWGAAFLYLFGESFTVLRYSILVIASLAAVVVYWVGIRCGLSRAYAFQAAVACLLSPVAIPLSSSFMTDIPGVFFGMLGVLLAGYSVQAKNPWRATAFFAAALSVSYFGGQVRQVVWMLLVGVAPMIVLTVRQPRGVRILWGMLLVLVIGLTFRSMVTLRQQPYAAIDDLADNFIAVARFPVRFCLYAISMLVTMLALLLPASLALWPLRRRLTPLIVVATIGLTVVAVTAATVSQGAQKAFEPWIGDVLSPYGTMLSGTDLIGAKPYLIPRPVNGLLALITWFTFSLVVCLAVRYAGVLWRSLVARSDLPQRLFGTTLGILIVYSTLAMSLSIVRSVSWNAFDRYILVALPTALIILLLIRQERISVRPSKTVWAAVTLAAIIGLSFSFEYHASLRARQTAAERLIASGVDRLRLSAGAEYDGLTQLSAVGYLNDSRIINPRDAYVPMRLNPEWDALADSHWIWPRTSAIRPEYLVAREVVRGYQDAGLGTVVFGSWYPPFRRELQILRLKPELREVPHLTPAPDR
jgi:hypothetical protein